MGIYTGAGFSRRDVLCCLEGSCRAIFVPGFAARIACTPCQLAPAWCTTGSCCCPAAFPGASRELFASHPSLHQLCSAVCRALPPSLPLGSLANPANPANWRLPGAQPVRAAAQQLFPAHPASCLRRIPPYISLAQLYVARFPPRCRCSPGHA